MVVRIYSLAKELKLDSKVLVDICTRAGVPGKGSALASLTEEEVSKVKAFMEGGMKAPPKAAPPAPVAAAPAGQAPASPVSPAPAPAAPVAPKPIAAVVAPPVDTGVLRREDYMAPGGTVQGKPPVLTPRREERSADAPKRPVEAKSRAPVIRVAKAPTVEQPTFTAASNEPAPQKPDIKLPLDAIRASKLGGAKPLQAHMRKAEERRKSDIEAAAAPPPTTSRGPARREGPGGPSRPGAGRPAVPMLPLDEAALARERARAKPGTGKPGGILDLTMREQRQLGRKKKVDEPPKRPGLPGDEDAPAPKRLQHTRRRMMRNSGANTAAPRKGNVTVEAPCNVRALSEALGVRAQQVMMKLLQIGGTMATINTELNQEMIELLAVEFGIEINLKLPADAESEMLSSFESEVDDPATLEPRAPVVTVLGHVDHGKTSLLDKIIGLNVVSGESGGITQHIRAYRVEKDGRPITFVDTPGHEAFTEMRARGANVTDIAIIVVAANDGVMPQTEEAISHARAAGVPIVIALNKTDLPGINYDRVYSQLVTAGLQPTEWGGETELVKCSAVTGAGIPELLETLLTIADLHEWKANPNRKATGTCLEASMDEGRGVMAKFLVQTGTLKVGDAIVCGASHGRVKALYDTLKTREELDGAGPSMPVNVTGLDEAPNAGDHFYVVEDVAQAREIAMKRAGQQRASSLGDGPAHVTLETLYDKLGAVKGVQTLNLILRADVRGSIEAIQKELQKLAHSEVQVKILQASVGGVSEADVYLADASDAVIIAFNVVPDQKARVLAADKGVEIRRYDIIYKVTDELRQSLEGMLKPEQREIELGRALVQRAFSISRVGTVAGCRVLDGTIERGARIRIIRDSRVVGDYNMESLKREKDDAREVREGMECGIKIANFNDIKEGDVLEAYKVEQVARTL